MVHEFIRQMKLARHFKPIKFQDKIKLPLAYLKFKLDSINAKLDMIVEVDGIKYRIIDFESLGIVSPRYEEYIQKVLRPEKNNVFVDVGAHIGRYSLQVAKSVGAEGRVIAIEADPDNFKALLEGIELNKLRNIVALNVAAYSRECKLPLYSSSGGKGRSSVVYGRDTITHRISAKPLDIILAKFDLPYINYMKVDVEGAEYEVLKGAKRTIEKYKPKIITNTTLNEIEILEFMKELDYKQVMINPTNYFFVPAH